MKEKNIKFILELIFIFIIPLCLLATCFNVEKVYDENNNEINKYLFYENGIFREYNDNLEYKNELYYNQLLKNNTLENSDYWNDSINFTTLNINNNEMEVELIGYIDSWGTILSQNIDFSNIRNHTIYIQFDAKINNLLNDNARVRFPSYENTTFSLTTNYTNYNFIVTPYEDNFAIQTFRFPEGTKLYFKNFIMIDLTSMYGNYTPTKQEVNDIINEYNLIDYQEKELTIYSNDIISGYYQYNYTWYSRIFIQLFNSLQINNNYILQIIITYTLLWLIMWFIWHLLYLPLDFICSKLLFDRVDK